VITLTNGIRPQAEQSPAIAGRPQYLRALNEATLLNALRRRGQLMRGDLVSISGLSKATIAAALTNLENAGLVRVAGQRTGMPGRVASLYEVNPDAGFVVALDVGAEYLRGALADLGGTVRASGNRRVHGASSHARTAHLIALAEDLARETGITREAITQTVIGSPGIYDPGRDALRLARQLPGWERPGVLAELRDAFGPTTMVENDVNLATLAEREHGHGKCFETFVFISIGTGFGMGLVLNGRPYRGAHGAAGEIGFLSVDPRDEIDPAASRSRGPLDAVGSAAGIIRAARLRGMGGRLTAKRIFQNAADGDEKAIAVVRDEVRIVARAIADATSVVDPALVVLGGGIGSAPGFADAVTAQLETLLPFVPEVRVSALGLDAIVQGGLAAGTEVAWDRLASH
jgi:predicted NBD/HSP70 family sugar kinase